MSATNISLTIAIPTYNGERTLAGALDSIVTQLQPGVEVLVSDNASTDQTHEIVRRYQADFPQISYRRNPVNLGAMKNYDLSVEHAKGDFVWLFGDDDKMTDGCIQKVMNVIETNSSRLGFIWISADIYGDNWIIRDRNPLGLEKDIQLDNADAVFATLKDGIGLTPTIIVRRSSWLSHPDLRKLTDNYWLHVQMVLAIAEYEETYIIASPPVMFSQAQVRWDREGLFLRIICEFCEMVLQLGDSVSYEHKRESIQRWYAGLWRQILIAKYNGWVLNFSQIGRLINIFKRFPRFWFFDLPLLFMPVKIVKALYFLKNRRKLS